MLSNCYNKHYTSLVNAYMRHQRKGEFSPMTKNEQTLYTYIIRILHKHSRFSRFIDTESPQNKYLTAEEIFAHLIEDAKNEPALASCLKQYPSLSPYDLDQFLSTVKDLEYPKEINPAYFSCNEENSEGKTIIQVSSSGQPFQYAVPKKRRITFL